MTNTQNRIEKSSKLLALVFFAFLGSSVLQGCIALWKLLVIFIDPAEAAVQASAQMPFATVFHVLLHQSGRCLIWLCYGAAFLLLYRIFRDVHREYTPFRQLHVQRLRQTAGYLAVVYALENGINALTSVMHKGFLSFTLKLDPFLLPLTLIGLSFILDYACQLQAEADTTL